MMKSEPKSLKQTVAVGWRYDDCVGSGASVMGKSNIYFFGVVAQVTDPVKTLVHSFRTD